MQAKDTSGDRDKKLLDIAEKHIKKGSEIYNKGEADINKRAEELYKEALICLLDIQRKDALIYIKIGMLYQWLRDNELALHYVDIALGEATGSDKYDAKYWKAIILFEGFKRNEESLSLFFECLDRETNPVKKLNILDWIMRIYISVQPDKEKIIDWIRMVEGLISEKDVQDIANENKLLPFGLYVVGLQQDGKYKEERMSIIELGLSLNKEDPQLLFAKARLMHTSGRKAEAQAIAKQLRRTENLRSFQLEQLDRILGNAKSEK